jgi:FKBP-type peptidyl-prolyl cis-trans isomerase
MKTALLVAGFVVVAAGACRKPAASPPPRPDALRIDEVKVGSGPVATRGKVVKVHYTGYLPDGTRFDSSLARQPFQFQLGQGSVLKGWDLGVEGMKVGGKRKLTLPPALAFGDRAVGQIKPHSTLVFDVELVAVQ